MAELYLVDFTTARVLDDGSDPARWARMQDALSHAISDRSATSVDVLIASARTWLWWFATDDAGTWKWDSALVEQLGSSSQSTKELSEVLAMRPAEQAVWPGEVDLDALGLARMLTDNQRRDVARMIRMRGGPNFSVPGSGKTTMALTVWAALRQLGVMDRCLVVAPLSAHEAWAHEPAEVFVPGFEPSVVVNPPAPTGDFIVMNYEKFQSQSNLDRYVTWCGSGRSLVIYDEAHRAKAGKSGARGAAALALGQAATQRIVLTGTPRPNSAQDLENVMEMAFPGQGIALARGPRATLRSAYSRTTKAELGLPELVPKTERVPMSNAHDRVYDAMVDASARAVLEDASLASDLQRAGRIAMLLLQAATDPTAVLDVPGRLEVISERSDLDLDELVRTLPANFTPTKLVRAVQLVKEHQEAGTKVLLWASFRHHVEQLYTLLQPFNPAIIMGGVPVLDPNAPTDRTRELDKFRNDESCSVLVATPHTLSEGVSLHHTTTHQIHLDRTFNAGMFLQSLDRTHRLGLPADANCTATYLVATRTDGSDTVDIVVAERLEAKISAMAKVLDDPGLEDLALPDLDDTLGPDELLLGSSGQSDLAELFKHLIGARR